MDREQALALVARSEHLGKYIARLTEQEASCKSDAALIENLRTQVEMLHQYVITQIELGNGALGLVRRSQNDCDCALQTAERAQDFAAHMRGLWLELVLKHAEPEGKA